MGTIAESLSRRRTTSRGRSARGVTNDAEVRRQVKIFNAKLRRVTKDFTKAEMRKVGRSGAAPVRTAARSKTPKGKEYHYRYDPKKKGSKRAAKGTRLGDRIAYKPGNLRKSIGTMTWRKSPDAFVGPRKYKGSAKPGDVMGATTKKADPYYAAMVFGSQRAFNRRVLLAAKNQARAKSLRRMGERAARIINAKTRKLKLR